LASFRSIADEMQLQRRRAIDELAPLCVELSLAVAEHLLKSEVEVDRQRLDRIVAQALERVPSCRAVTVRAHPADIALLERQCAEHVDLARYRPVLALQGDDTFQRGQLRLEADEWFVDWDTPRALGE